MTPIDSYQDALAKAANNGLLVESLKLDGEWHRVPLAAVKSKRKLDGAYCLSELTLKSGKVAIVGMFHNWKTGISETLTLDDRLGATAEEMAEARRKAKEAAEQSKRAKAEQHETTAKRALTIWNKLPEQGRAPYLFGKGVRAWGLRFGKGDSVVVPAADIDGKLWTLQFIQKDGSKKFLTGGAKRGRFHLLNSPGLPDLGQANLIGIAEGYATAASIYESFNGGFPIAVAFDAGNIAAVAQAFRAKFPQTRIVIFADNDRFNTHVEAFIPQSKANNGVLYTVSQVRAVCPSVPVEVVPDDDPRLRSGEYNIGVAKAILAAAEVYGEVVIPVFSESPERLSA